MMASDILKHITESESLGIITHILPDGDALGSMLALGLALEKRGMEPLLIKNDEIPKKYEFLPGQHLMRKGSPAEGFPETLVVLDCGDRERLGEDSIYFENATTVINIDHHISNTMFGCINYVDTNAAATAEIVYRIIKLMGETIDFKIATCLFTAIVADTGCFRYDNTTWTTLSICGELINLGVKPNWICQRVFAARTLSQTKILGKAIESLQVFHGGKTSVMVVTREMMEKSGSSQGDLEGVIDFARDIEGVEVAVLMREISDNEFKIGFRSSGYVDVSAVAGRFGGGGHKKASGCTINAEFCEALKLLLQEIEKNY